MAKPPRKFSRYEIARIFRDSSPPSRPEMANRTAFRQTVAEIPAASFRSLLRSGPGSWLAGARNRATGRSVWLDLNTCVLGSCFVAVIKRKASTFDDFRGAGGADRQ